MTQSVFGQEHRKEIKKLLDEAIANSKKTPELAVEQVIEAFDIAKEERDFWAIMNTKNTMGYISNVQRDYKAAFINYNEALEFLKKADTVDLSNEMVINQNLASIYRKYGTHDKAIYHYEQAEVLAKKYKEEFPKLFAASAYSNTLTDLPYRRALVYRNQGDYEAVGKILLPMWDKTRKDQDTLALARVLNQIGLHQKRLGDYTEAAYYYDLIIGANGIDPKIKGIAQHNMGSALLAAGDYKQAKEYYSDAMATKTEHGSKRSQFITYLDMGELYYKTGKTQKAIETWNAGLTIFDKVEGEPDLFEVYNWLQLAHIKLQSEKAIEYNATYKAMNQDWRREQERLKAVNGSLVLQRAYDAHKAAIAEEYQTTQWWKVYGPWGLALVLGIAALVLMVLRTRRAKADQALLADVESIRNKYQR